MTEIVGYKKTKQLSKMMLPITDVKHFAFLFLSIMFQFNIMLILSKLLLIKCL